MTYIIAEIGNNHEGSQEVAMQLMQNCIYVGADAIKLQAFTAEELVHPDMPSLVPPYPSQLERMKKLELPLSFFLEASEICTERNIDFIVSPFSVRWVEELKHEVDYFKVASGEITNMKLLLALASTDKPTFISTGMASIDEIRTVLEVFRTGLAMPMHCVSLYPCPIEKAGLNRIKELQDLTSEPVGYSDHCIGTQACLTAVALGVKYIEKHVTTGEQQFSGRGDHVHSLTPFELEKFIKEIGQVESSLPFMKLEDYHMRRKLRRGRSGLREG